ncbi:3-isopropylmalate dehydratase small subunit [Candidimonas nitroreducens]|uniref:3-isopropylmalate dehydratase small subunit n=1 Tax=Candidimonas nitroreducens TaxID=683354 RepID=A0A225MKD7_9BURK|nr:3-isopropylmalate dehydratase small subunit [Candidimonas nitroreducens]OWT61714.1 3-isopropylmalate dehydratase small subunit [Candidimonas nitroreducens]
MAQPFTMLDAIAAPLDAENVDTDQILPARFLKKPRELGYGSYLFHDQRFDDCGKEISGFVLNRPAFRDAPIIVANHNFGCGSSREGAAYALYDYGVRCVVAPSFSDIFYRNCLRNGIVPVRLASDVCARMRTELVSQPGQHLVVDLGRQQVCDWHGSAYTFAIDPFHRELLLHGVDEIELTLSMLPAVAAFERDYYRIAPWSLPHDNSDQS